MAWGIVRVGQNRILPPPRDNALDCIVHGGRGGQGAGGMVAEAGEEILLDDFEDGNITEYSNGAAEFEATTDYAGEGDYAIGTTGYGGSPIFRTDKPVEIRDRIEYMGLVYEGIEGLSAFLFAVQDANNWYGIKWDCDLNVMCVGRRLAGEIQWDASVGISFSIGAWYDIIVDWASSGLITVSAFGVEIVYTYTDWSSGGFGFYNDVPTVLAVNYWDCIKRTSLYNS